MLKKVIKESLSKYPIVGLIGCRQVGKTTLANMILKESKNAIYLDLELPSDVMKLQDPELYLSQFSDKLIIIDEFRECQNYFQY